MDYCIQLFYSIEKDPRQVIPLIEVVRYSLQGKLGEDLTDTKIKLALYRYPEDFFANQTPGLVNLLPEFGFIGVQIFRNNRRIYQHPHFISELISRVLEEKTNREHMDNKNWSFRLIGPGIPLQSSMRIKPQVANGFTVDVNKTGETPRFTIRRLSDPPLEGSTALQMGIERWEPRTDALVQVVISRQLKEDLLSRNFSQDMEEGGFLTGKAYQDLENEGRYLVKIESALPALHTGASIMHFTFTPDSFADYKNRLQRERPAEFITGWYHTHLFPATETFGLSAFDDVLHFGTFTIPWQTAGLINIDGDQRTIRFYTRKENEMILCSLGVLK